MGRYTGKTTIGYTFNVDDYRPLDTRMLVPTFADLLDVSNWQIAGESNAYNGMIVAVGSNTSDPSKNGVYYLFDADNPGADDLPDVTKEANWHRLTDAADVPYVTTTAFEEYTSNNNAAVQSLETRVGTAKVGDTAATGLFARVDTVADEVADLITSTTANTDKLEGIATTVTQAIDQAIEAAILTIPKLDVATTDNLGGIKSGTGNNIVSVDATGIASVNSISVSSLSQTDDELLILRGGDTLTNV